MNSIGVLNQPGNSGGNTGTGGGASDGDAKAFSAAAGALGLTVSGNAIDTGRYVIMGSNQYVRPNDGSTAGDGMVSIMDKTTNSFVDVFGDPHVYTSAGDRAEFQQDSLWIDLGDGAQVQIKPTALDGGVSHIDSVAVTKGGQTVTESGFYSAGNAAKVATGGVQQGGPAAAFNDPNAIVMTAAPGGGLDTLANAAGVQLSSKTSETALDGMGGAAAPDVSPGDVSPELVADLQKLLALLQKEMGAAGMGAAANGDIVGGGQASQSAPSQGGAGAGLAPSVQTLIGLLQPMPAQEPAPASQTAPAAAAGGGQDAMMQELATLLRDLMSLLQASAARTSGGELAGLLQQLLSLLSKSASAAIPPAAAAAPAADALPVAAPTAAPPTAAPPIAASLAGAAGGAPGVLTADGVAASGITVKGAAAW